MVLHIVDIPNKCRLFLFLLLAVCGCSNDRAVPFPDESTSADKGVSASTQTVADPVADDNEDDKLAVRKAWFEFKEACLTGEGEIAADRVTASTHQYYDEIRKLALQASREKLDEFVLAKKCTVLGVRLRMPTDQLRSFSGRQLFVHCVDQGWIGKNNATDEDISTITVMGDHARAVATKSSQPTGQYYHFIKQDGMWRLDMLQLMKVVNPAFDEMLKQSGLTEAEFTKRVLEATTGKVVTEELWIPPDG